jgi:hypothetical protein
MDNKNQYLCVLPEWEVLVSEAVNWEIGKIYTYEEIENTIKLKKGERKYYYHINKAIDELTSRGVRLTSIPTVGYKVLNPDEWSTEANRRMKRGGKFTEDAFKILANAPLVKMSEEKRSECLKMQDLIIRQKFMLSGGLVEFTSPQKNIPQIRGGKE